MTTNNIDKIFKKGLGDHEFEVPESVWQNVEQQLDGRSSNRRVWLVAASVALLLGVGAAWLSTGGSQPEPQTAGTTVDTTVAPQPAPAQIDYAPNYADSAVYAGE
ncbi:MAG: hypothetical protein IKN94_03210 [Salinivirgaceae bacterium]|nr:hypothetical protein [Salinivirgaceae bacterium]